MNHPNGLVDDKSRKIYKVSSSNGKTGVNTKSIARLPSLNKNLLVSKHWKNSGVTHSKWKIEALDLQKKSILDISGGNCSSSLSTSPTIIDSLVFLAPSQKAKPLPPLSFVSSSDIPQHIAALNEKIDRLQMAANTIITLTSSDNCTFHVSVESVKNAGGLLDHIRKSSDVFMENGHNIKLPTVNSECLIEVIRFLDGPTDFRISNLNICLDLLISSIYLDLPGLADLCINEITRNIKDLETLENVPVFIIHQLLRKQSIGGLLICEFQHLSLDRDEGTCSLFENLWKQKLYSIYPILALKEGNDTLPDLFSTSDARRFSLAVFLSEWLENRRLQSMFPDKLVISSLQNYARDDHLSIPFLKVSDLDSRKLQLCKTIAETVTLHRIEFQGIWDLESDYLSEMARHVHEMVFIRMRPEILPMVKVVSFEDQVIQLASKSKVDAGTPIERLCLKNVRFGKESISSMVKLSTLKELKVSKGLEHEVEILLDLIGNTGAQKLKSLELSDSGIPQFKIHAFIQDTSSTLLTHLHLINCALPSALTTQLIAKQVKCLKGLKSLNLSWNQISWRLIKELLGLLPDRLEALELEGNGIERDLVTVLSADFFAKKHRLQRISFSYCTSSHSQIMGNLLLFQIHRFMITNRMGKVISVGLKNLNVTLTAVISIIKRMGEIEDDDDGSLLKLEVGSKEIDILLALTGEQSSDDYLKQVFNGSAGKKGRKKNVILQLHGEATKPFQAGNMIFV